MKEYSIPTGIDTDSGVHHFRHVFDAFAATDHGRVLSERVRFERYKPESVTNQEWEAVLGADVNNLNHMPLTYGLTRQFLRHSERPAEEWDAPIPPEANFSRDEQQLLLLTAAMHDWGEAVIGDKMFDLKKASDEDGEMTELSQIARSLYGTPEGAAVLNKIDYVINEVLPNRESKLGKAFNAIERLGYLRSGLRAWETSKIIIASNPDLSDGLQWMTNNVLLNQIPTLLEYRTIYPPVEVYLQRNADVISDAFERVPFHSFDGYSDQERPIKIAAFNHAHGLWNQVKD